MDSRPSKPHCVICVQGSVTKNMMFPAASDMKLPGLLSFDSEDVANLLLALARDPGAHSRASAGIRSVVIVCLDNDPVSRATRLMTADMIKDRANLPSN